VLSPVLRNDPPATPPLTISYSLSIYDLAPLVSAKHVRTQLCAVFGEELVYAHYGPPSMRVEPEGSSTKFAHRPVVFLFRSTLLREARDVYPFDTQAFASGRLAAFFDSHLPITHFRVEPDNLGPGRIVAHFFGDNAHYIGGLPLSTISANLYENAVFELYRSKRDAIPGRPRSDAGKLDPLSAANRPKTIEIVLAKPVPLEGQLVAAILPETLATQDLDLIRDIEALGADWVSYFDPYDFDPKLDFGVIVQKVVELMKEYEQLT
jgi:hypothetical protein